MLKEAQVVLGEDSWSALLHHVPSCKGPLDLKYGQCMIYFYHNYQSLIALQNAQSSGMAAIWKL